VFHVALARLVTTKMLRATVLEKLGEIEAGNW